ncbi:glycosyltransferase [Sphingomonas sp. ST-64]|uniref:Glycosyltransferase n=1 Tax=Sphingomonas plantiphila TaxID=3163295 RepID=A0ABW8YKW7_9SPHN
MRRLKILQVLTSLGPGGAERLVLNMMDRFDVDRFDVRLAILMDDRRALDVYGHTDVPVQVFDMRGKRAPAALAAMRRYIAALSPDVIHAHMFHPLVAATLTSGGASPAPALCFTSHCNELAFPPLRSAIVRLLRRRRTADIIFVEGQHPSLNAPHVVVIPNGVNVPATVPPRAPWEPDGPVRLVAIGRLADQKDPLGLIQTIATLDNERVTLDFYGEGPLQDEMRALIERLNLGERIRLRGLSRDVRSVMGAADIMVMPSKFEGMPMVMLEAGSEAMPIIATPVGAIASILSPDRGVIAEAEGFGAALARMIAEPDASLAAGARLRDYIDAHHSIAATTRMHERVYAGIAPSGRTVQS